MVADQLPVGTYCYFSRLAFKWVSMKAAPRVSTKAAS